MRKLNKCLIVFTCGFIFAIALLLVVEDDSKMSDDEKSISFKVPLLAKFGTLIERERSYKAVIERMISDETKIEDIWNSIKNFPIVSELKGIQGDLPSQYGFRNITQHEYQVLLKQYGAVGEQALNFCNLMAIAGYPASPVYNNYGLVIVRSGPQNFLYFNFENRKMIKSTEIMDNYRKMWEEELNELDESSKNFFGKKYLHAYAQISRHRFWYIIIPWRGKAKMEDYLIAGPVPAYLISRE